MVTDQDHNFFLILQIKASFFIQKVAISRLDFLTKTRFNMRSIIFLSSNPAPHPHKLARTTAHSVRPSQAQSPTSTLLACPPLCLSGLSSHLRYGSPKTPSLAHYHHPPTSLFVSFLSHTCSGLLQDTLSGRGPQDQLTDHFPWARRAKTPTKNWSISCSRPQSLPSPACRPVCRCGLPTCANHGLSSVNVPQKPDKTMTQWVGSWYGLPIILSSALNGRFVPRVGWVAAVHGVCPNLHLLPPAFSLRDMDGWDGCPDSPRSRGSPFGHMCYVSIQFRSFGRLAASGWVGLCSVCTAAEERKKKKMLTHTVITPLVCFCAF